MEFHLRAKKLQIVKTNVPNVKFQAILEPKYLVVVCGRDREKFAYKKIKHSLSMNNSEITIQSDGLRIVMDRSFGDFEQHFFEALNGSDGLNSRSVGARDAMVSKRVHESTVLKYSAGSSSDSRVPKTGSFVSSVSVKRTSLSSPSSNASILLASPSAASESATSSLELSPRSSSNSKVLSAQKSVVVQTDAAGKVAAGPKTISIASVFRRPAAAAAPSVNTVHTASTSDEASASSHQHSAFTAEEWYEESDALDLSSNNTNTSTPFSNPINSHITSTSDHAKKTPPAAIVTYGKGKVTLNRPSAFSSALSMLSPAPTAKTLFGPVSSNSGSSGHNSNSITATFSNSYSSSASCPGSLSKTQGSTPASGERGSVPSVTDGTPYHKLFGPATEGRDLAPPKQKATWMDLLPVRQRLEPPEPVTVEMGVDDDDDGDEGENEAVRLRPAPPRAAFSIMDSIRKHHTGTLELSNGRNSASSSSRIPGGIRNLGNSCYVASVLQALFAVEGLRAVLLSPFWTSLVEQQGQGQGQGSMAHSITASNAGTVFEGRPVTPVAALTQQEPSGSPVCSVSSAQDDAAPVVVEGTLPPDASGALDKYRVHSVFLELSKLFRAKADLPLDARVPAPLYSSTLSTGPSSSPKPTVLDVTRLKRAMVHHTKKFAGYSQQDAQEFLSDLLEALQSELQDRFAVFAEFARYSVPCSDAYSSAADNASETIAAAGLHCCTPAPLREGGVGDVSVVSGDATMRDKRTREGEEEDLDTQCGKKSRTDENGGVSTILPTPHRHRPTVTSISAANLVTPEGAALAKTSTTLSCAPCSRMMQSSVRVELRCTSCGQSRDPLCEEYQHFPLDLSHSCDSGGNAQDLSALLRRFFADETRELTCEHCSEGGHATVHTSLAQLPVVLVLQLKRFEYDTLLQRMVKVSADVDFPSRLDLGKFAGSGAQSPAASGLWSSGVEAVMKDAASFAQFWDQATVDPAPTSPCSNTIYELTSVLRHIGKTEGAGHYICDVRQSEHGGGHSSAEPQKWRRHDDSLVTNVSQETVMQERDTPYLFFYTKR